MTAPGCRLTAELFLKCPTKSWAVAETCPGAPYDSATETIVYDEMFGVPTSIMDFTLGKALLMMRAKVGALWRASQWKWAKMKRL